MGEPRADLGKHQVVPIEELLAECILKRPDGPPSPSLVEPSRRTRTGALAYLELFAVRAALLLGAISPGPVRKLWIWKLATIGRLFDRRHSRAAREFIRTAYPEASDQRVEQLVRAAWRHLPRVVLESARLRHMIGSRLGDHYDLKLCPGVESILEQGTGALILTPHVGIWEALASPLGAMGFAPFHAVGKAPRNGHLADFIARQRRESGARMISRKGAMKEVPTVVRAGGSVLMLLDHRARSKPILAPFFGRPAACDRSAGVLVRRLGAPLVFVGCYFQAGPRPYRLEFSKVILPEELAGLDPVEIMTRVNQENERLIRACPEQYFWLHDRFKELPHEG